VLDFQIVPRDYDKVLEIVLQEVPSFGESLEFAQLSDYEREIPGVVCAAFTKFLQHYQTEATNRALSTRETKILSDCYRLIERFSSSADPEVVNLVVVEIFENLNCERQLLQQIKSKLGPKSKELYERWIGKDY
jgi:hypothetical protein